jgi:flagellum-specific peptidoglycan hydrolase FlgJ
MIKNKLLTGILLIPLLVNSQTPETVLTELKKQNVKHPEIVLAQSIEETGWYKCNDCSMSKNNIFGLWNSRKKEYYEYDTWQLSIGGYKRGIQYKYDASKYKDYYEFLEKIGYASNPKYISNIKKIIKKLNK